MQRSSQSHAAVSAGRDSEMNKDESVEKTLREAGIFPPSVQYSHYGDKPEMTREEIVEKTLREMSLYSSSEEDSQSSHKVGRLSAIIAAPQSELGEATDICPCERSEWTG